MEVRSCKGCGRLFNYVSGVSYTNLCPKCIEELEDKFQVAKKYIEDNRGAGIEEVAEVANVSTRQIERWVREERLCFADDSAIGIACNGCGKMIKSGNYCPECKDAMQKGLGSLYSKGNVIERKKPGAASARMRFLDN